MKRLLFLTIFLTALLLPLAAAYGVVWKNPEMNPQYGMGWTELAAGEKAVLKVKNGNVALVNLTFIINKDASSPSITAYNLLTLPDFLPEIDFAFEHLQLKFQSFRAKDISSAVYIFKVAKDWLTDTKVSRDSIRFYYYDNIADEWALIKSEILTEDTEAVFFKATGLGADYFVIAKEMSAVTEETVKETVKEETKETTIKKTIKDDAKDVTKDITSDMVVEEADLTTPPAAPAPAAPTPEVSDAPVDDFTGSKKTTLVISIVVIMFLVAVFFLVIIRKLLPVSTIDKELDKYVSDARKRGKSDFEIRDRLLNVGWSRDRVEGAIAKKKGKAKEIPIDAKEEKDKFKAKVKSVKGGVKDKFLPKKK